MEDKTFNWKPDTNQTYSENTSITLESKPNLFSKLSGKSFSMEAPSQTLTLKAIETDDKNERITIWGAGGTADLATFNFYGGTLAYDANSTQSALALSGSFTDPGSQLSFYHDGRFMVQNGFIVMSQSTLKIDLHDKSNFDVATSGLTMGGAISVKIFEEASMALRAQQSFSLVHAYLEIATNSAPNTALVLSCDGPEGLLLDDVQIEFMQKAKGLLRAPLLDCKGISQIRVENNAQVDLQFDSVKMKGGSTFILSYGEGNMSFSGYSEGETSFNFMNNDYPKGMFNFITQSGTNNCQLQFKGDKLNGFEAKALVGKGLIAVNGEPQYNQDKIDVRLEQGLITAKIRRA